MDIRRRIWEIIEVSREGDKLSYLEDLLILVLVLLSVSDTVLMSVKPLAEQYGELFNGFDTFVIVVFSVEYAARILFCTSDPEYRHPIWGRLRQASRPLVILDLLSILPFYISWLSLDLIFLRVFRVARILRVAKLARYVSAFNLMTDVVRRKREELLVTLGMMALLVIVSSCLLYEAENSVQPTKFPDIPSSMWWAIATLTTVGYGDVYPITGMGQFLASVTAILGIGFFALPTGILGAGFVEEIQRKKAPQHCPHCGKAIHK
ncbi:MAG: ion transporter [Candidatus Hydrogenedentes bacterium]|nr:ion transporter [Candidatus Hydrogenedentota bacterium]